MSETLGAVSILVCLAERSAYLSVSLSVSVYLSVSVSVSVSEVKIAFIIARKEIM